jgi:hypothetical protein
VAEGSRELILAESCSIDISFLRCIKFFQRLKVRFS